MMEKPTDDQIVKSTSKKQIKKKNKAESAVKQVCSVINIMSFQSLR